MCRTESISLIGLMKLGHSLAAGQAAGLRRDFFKDGILCTVRAVVHIWLIKESPTYVQCICDSNTILRSMHGVLFQFVLAC